MLLLEFSLPVATPLLNEWQRKHWRARARITNYFAWLIHEQVGKWDEPEPIQRCCIEIERHSAGLPDWDGLYGGLKPLLDAMVRCTGRNPHGLGIIEDDGPKVVERLTAVPVKSTRGNKKTVVRIYSVNQGGTTIR